MFSIRYKLVDGPDELLLKKFKYVLEKKVF